ncbi:MAG TPA: hypothetical protein VLM79_05685 [Kofleriaceae bacterium]|nr:hypothetical protein [Kofleriaceae bacterium]
MKYYLGLSYVFVATACAAGDGTTTDPQSANPDPTQDLGEVGQPDDPVQSAESTQPAQSTAPQAQGMSAPTISCGGSTTMPASTSLTGGPGVHLNGGTDIVSGGSATYYATSNASTVTTELTVNPAPNAAFQYLLLGSGKSYATKQLRIQRVPGSDALQAIAGNAPIDCGALPSSQATPVTLSWDSSAGTFDVLIAGAPSACMNVATRMEGPVRGIRMIDQAFEGYGGQVDFTDLSLF